MIGVVGKGRMADVGGGISVRPFRPPDLGEVYEIERASFPSPWPKFYFRLLHLKNPDGFLVAEVDGRIAGYIVVDIEHRIELQNLKLKRYGHILNLAVHRDFRRRGVATALIRRAFKHLRDVGAEGVWLEVRESNLPARRLYSKLGFKVTGRITRYYLNEDAIVMERRL